METGHPQFDEMIALAERQCDSLLSANELARLEHILVEDAALRREYLRYRFLHAHLMSSDAVVASSFDETQLCELTDEKELQACLAELSDISSTSLLDKDRRPVITRQRVVAALSTLAFACAMLGTLLATLVFLPSPGNEELWPNAIAFVTRTGPAQWSTQDQPFVRGQGLGPGTLRLRSGQAGLKFGNGAEISLAGPTTFGLESESFASLFSGKMSARLEKQEGEFTLQAGAVRVVDRGTEFGVEVNDDGTTEVHCLDGKIETQARARLPMLFWNFDRPDGVVIDSITRRTAKIGSGASLVEGLVGRGAMSFDNTPQAQVNVGNGGGTQIGTGRFGVSSGVTIEALTIIRWPGDGESNGKTKDYDDIFRKEDGPKRMLLCFQNDGGAAQRNVPAMARYGPTLSFGLHLAGDGYSELEVRLDGQQGPSLESLRDGQPHHVVATYDSWTGVKSLYIDGALVRTATFEKGTLIESGGPTDAMIGNLSGGGEPYAGVIDEVAIYAFALTREEVVEHWRNARAGRNYFGTQSAETLRGASWQTTKMLTAGQAMRFDSTTGLPVQTIPVSAQRFRTQ